MATAKGSKTDGRATLRGRFRPGSDVRLFKIDPEQLRPHEDDTPVAEGKVDEHGHITFDKGIEVGGHYIAAGYVDGFPLNIRLRGKRESDAETDVHAPVVQDEVRTRGGQLLPERGHHLVSPVTRAPHNQAKKDAIAITEKREAAAKKRASAKKSTTAKKAAKPAAKKGASK